MRVAFLSVGDTTRLTGGYRYNARVVEGLRARGVEVDEVVPCGASPEEQSSSRGEPVPDPLRYDVIVVDALARIVVSPHLDAWRAGRPVVALVHELQSVAGPSEMADTERTYELPMLRADALVAVSGHGAAILRSRGVSPERVRVVYPGSDTYGPDTEAYPVEQASQPRVVCVAQWIPRKGILELVRAWRASATGDAVLELIGETDADSGYSSRVRAAMGDDPSIIVRGAVDDAAVRSAYGRAGVFALPSRYEGYGVVYAEALRAGLPILACDVGPVPELVGPEAAVLVPAGDHGALVGGIERLVGDPALRARMSRAALRRAFELPRWRDTVRRFHEVLRDAVRTGSSG